MDLKTDSKFYKYQIVHTRSDNMVDRTCVVFQNRCFCIDRPFFSIHSRMSLGYRQLLPYFLVFFDFGLLGFLLSITTASFFDDFSFFLDFGFLGFLESTSSFFLDLPESSLSIGFFLDFGFLGLSECFLLFVVGSVSGLRNFGLRWTPK